MQVYTIYYILELQLKLFGSQKIKMLNEYLIILWL